MSEPILCRQAPLFLDREVSEYTAEDTSLRVLEGASDQRELPLQLGLPGVEAQLLVHPGPDAAEVHFDVGLADCGPQDKSIVGFEHAQDFEEGSGALYGAVHEGGASREGDAVCSSDVPPSSPRSGQRSPSPLCLAGACRLLVNGPGLELGSRREHQLAWVLVWETAGCALRRTSLKRLVHALELRVGQGAGGVGLPTVFDDVCAELQAELVAYLMRQGGDQGVRMSRLRAARGTSETHGGVGSLKEQAEYCGIYGIPWAAVVSGIGRGSGGSPGYASCWSDGVAAGSEDGYWTCFMRRKLRSLIVDWHRRLDRVARSQSGVDVATIASLEPASRFAAAFVSVVDETVFTWLVERFIPHVVSKAPQKELRLTSYTRYLDTLSKGGGPIDPVTLRRSSRGRDDVCMALRDAILALESEAPRALRRRLRALQREVDAVRDELHRELLARPRTRRERGRLVERFRGRETALVRSWVHGTVDDNALIESALGTLLSPRGTVVELPAALARLVLACVGVSTLGRMRRSGGGGG